MGTIPFVHLFLLKRSLGRLYGSQRQFESKHFRHMDRTEIMIKAR